MKWWKKKLASALLGAAVLALPINAAQAQERTCRSQRSKIVGGEAARIAEWPGQAVLRLHSETGRVSLYFCGGTAIGDRWILTAAHCMPDFVSRLTGLLLDADGREHEGRLEVVLGAGNLTTVNPEQVFAVERVIVHERYRSALDKALQITAPLLQEEALDRVPGDVGDDIALVRLARPWGGELSELSLSADVDPVTPPGAQVRVAGFGKTEHSYKKTKLDRFERSDGKGELFAGSSRLLETAVETIATPRCAARYRGKVIGPNQVCAGLELGGKDSCQGDSGGPLVMMDARGCPRQIGVVSWGEGCAAKDAYGVYTRVSAFADWIQQHTGPLKGAAPDQQHGSVAVLTMSQLDEGLRQLETLLGATKGKVRIGIKSGNRVRLGQKVTFEAVSELAGKLIILDINANREVTLIYPNRFVAKGEIGRIKDGQRVPVPGPDYPGFTAFQAVEPIGHGLLLALVVPVDFDIERFAADKSVVIKGFQPIGDPPSYMMRIVRQIERALALPARTGGESGELRRWGYAIIDYEIVR